MLDKSKLHKTIERAVTDLGYEFVGLEVGRQGSKQIYRIFVDTSDGIRVAQLQYVSRQIDAFLHIDFPELKDIVLEVSSPGLDRRLFSLEHFIRFTGKEVKVRLKKPINEQRNFIGVIYHISGDEIELKTETGDVRINFDQIEKANLVPDFSKK